MLRLLLALLIITLSAGCMVERVPQFSPRRSPTPEHLAATRTEDCRACHDVNALRKHAPKDDCFRCHIICRECPQ